VPFDCQTWARQTKAPADSWMGFPKVYVFFSYCCFSFPEKAMEAENAGIVT